MKVKLAAYVIMIVAISGFVEILSYSFFQLDMTFVRDRTYVYPRVTAEQFRDYIQIRHPVLGWPSTQWMESHSDERGARTSPANETLSNMPVCVSLYGDSFTYSLEVSNADAWPNLVARNLGCRVLNYGADGYGVGQAVKRFDINESDDAPITILGIFLPRDLNRSMNQWRFLLSGNEPLSFKPRYKVKDNRVEFVPLPVNTYQEFMRIAETPELLLDEHFLPGRQGPASQITTGFPYTFSIAKLAVKLFAEIDVGKISIQTPIQDWNFPPIYDGPGGPSNEKIFLNKKIIERFQEICEERNKRCFVVLIPYKDTLRTIQGRRLSKEIALDFGEHAETWDAAEYFYDETRAQGICYYIGKDRDCANGRHFNEDGYRLLSTFVTERLKEKFGSVFFSKIGDREHDDE